MPGGGTPLLNSSYSKAADLLLELAMAKNNKGIYFPVWATCLSFEKLITYYTGNSNVKWETKCDVNNLSLNTEFPQDLNLNSTRMFANAGHIVDIMKKDNVTANYHHVCLSKYLNT